MSAGERLRGLARRYRRRRAVAMAWLAGGSASLAAALALRGGAGWIEAVGIGAGVLLVVAALVWRLGGRVSDRGIARHLDRTVAGAEESSELLLRDESSLPLVERLQRRRTVAAIDGAALRTPPDRIALRSAIGGSLAFLAGLALALVPVKAPARSAGAPSAGTPAATAPRVAHAAVEIRPPAYTGRPVRRQDGLEVEAEAGAEIGWRIKVHGTPTNPRLVTSVGDTVALAGRGNGELEARLVATRSLLYQVVLDEATEAAEIHRIVVRADAAPEVTVLRPSPRSELAPGASLRVPVEVLVTDDHGTAAAELVATVTTGSGEGVRFREQRIALSLSRRARGGDVFRTELDLAALGMAPGDELYFHALARDRRPPKPNEGRSATAFLSLADTAAPPAPLIAGVSLPVAPEYFRSQRQIIIDTERLVGDAARLPQDVFRERSNAIGIDQSLLRLRYGQFTGEEFEEEAEPGEVHDHDSEGNATLLDPSVKATLKAAIAEMWAAELRLRTYRPAEALPYEYRALELIKSVQQASRAYVQRVGFEPPPLEVDRRRLTAELSGVRSRTVVDSMDRSDDRGATRRALATLHELREGARASPADRATLAEAEDELAGIAAGGAGAHLSALRSLRSLRLSLRDGPPCTGCVRSAEAALTASLPPPPPAGRSRGAGGALAKRYADYLGATP